MANNYYIEVTIDASLIPSTQTNYPFLFSEVIATLKTTANAGHVENANGYDITFCNEPDGTDVLDFEVEKYVATTGEIVAWIRIPSLDDTVDTTFYICYGDSGISTYQGDDEGVWNSNFVAVYHFAKNGNLSLLDSTTNDWDLTEGSAPNPHLHNASGIVNGCAEKSVATVSDFSNSSFGHLAPPWTYEGWFQLSALNDYRGLIRNYDGGNQGYQCGISNNNKPNYTRRGIAEHIFSTMSAISATTWYYICFTMNAAGTSVKCYIAGVGGALDDETIALASNSILGTPTTLVLGDGVFSNSFWDEYRVSNVERSTDWVTLTFTLQDDPSSFVTIGSEQTNVPATPINLNLSSSISFGDAFGGEAPYNFDTSGSITFSDNAYVNVPFDKTASSDFAYSDALATQLTLILEQLASSNLTFSDDVITQIYDLLERLATSELSFSDTLELLLGIQTSLTSSFTLSDTLVTVISNFVTRALESNFLLTDNLRLQLTKVMVFNDTIAYSDFLQLANAIQVQISSELEFTDSVDGTQPPSVVNVSVTSVLTFSDSISRTLSDYLTSYLRRYLNDVVN